MLNCLGSSSFFYGLIRRRENPEVSRGKSSIPCTKKSSLLRHSFSSVLNLWESVQLILIETGRKRKLNWILFRKMFREAIHFPGKFWFQAESSSKFLFWKNHIFGLISTSKFFKTFRNAVKNPRQIQSSFISSCPLQRKNQIELSTSKKRIVTKNIFFKFPNSYFSVSPVQIEKSFSLKFVERGWIDWQSPLKMHAISWARKNCPDSCFNSTKF